MYHTKHKVWNWLIVTDTTRNFTSTGNTKFTKKEETEKPRYTPGERRMQCTSSSSRIPVESTTVPQFIIIYITHKTSQHITHRHRFR